MKALFGGLGVYINLWIVEALCSPVEFIEYRNSARELPVSLIIANSFSTSATALLSKTKVQPHQLSHITLLLIKKKSKEVLHILFLSNILFLILSRPLFEFLFAQKFTNAWKIFDWYLLLVIPRALFPQTLVNALGLWKQSYLITILECLLHIILSFVLTYFLGTTGAAIATLIAFSFEKILLNWLLYKKNIAPTCFIPAIIFLLYTIIIVLLFSLKLIFYS
ncbi:MAG: hypothetical protein RML72_12265 [Bacteroidia bacterium]|nr:hypothetical protein [Bacteroidia bacterium]MDW8159632.1 hypothetical protein [Bacteroidia bacterium]